MRTPPRSSSSKDRDTTCTTELSDGSARRHVSDAGRRHDRGSGRSSREAGPALGAAALQHGAAGAGRHAGAETVALGSSMGVGLKCALHESSSATLACTPNRWPFACCKTLCSTGAPGRTCDLARLSGDRGRATTGLARRNCRSRCTFWHLDGSCYGPAPATRRPACPHLWTSVWTFARRAFQECDQQRRQGVPAAGRECDRSAG